MSKDQKHFNCSEEHEIEYVASLYAHSEKVKQLLKDKCKSKEIHYSTHAEVYALIEKELKYPLPH
ncbi:hypothetical protein EHQ64_18870 [Leptospira sarikeiensis]|uniref:Uncharacterized protein n=1 Tax=Leptospira sarikeiensis TaxID=2484943 RepID=A0A4R9K174_9LEPT|nr:hypothetical protein EHQ64_18870 [Leptospira sarikeiensis]